MASPTPLRWGILATGGIATTFSKDLLVDPSSRGVTDVAHTIVAAASSTSAQRAADFLANVGAPSSAKPYGSYAELVADPDVDIVYVATPHSHHYQNAMLCLDAGKPVLCEKALTVTAEQARRLVAKARDKSLFFMEAVWTRYFPLSIHVRDLITKGEIGPVYRATADLSLPNDAGDGTRLSFPDENRMVNLDLAGGALLDLGIYSITWLFQALYHTQPEPETEKEKPKVLAAINKYPVTGSDESTAVILSFPGHKSQGVALTTLRVGTNANGAGEPAAVRIQGAKGEIQIAHPIYRPTSYRVLRAGTPEIEVVDCPIPTDPKTGWGHGMFWEADECARCLRDGKKQSASLPWSESLVIMEVLDEALKQGGVVYPEVITTHEFDPKSPLNTGKA